MDEIRKSTPADTNKQVDLCVAIANRVFELLQERNMRVCHKSVTHPFFVCFYIF